MTRRAFLTRRFSTSLFAAPCWAFRSVTSNDADIEGSDLTVNGIRTGGENDTGTTGNIGSPLTGTYGNITINGDGSYTYELDTTNENLAKIPAGHNFYETFTYTVTDDTGQTSTAEIVIKINGVNDAPNMHALITRQRALFQSPSRTCTLAQERCKFVGKEMPLRVCSNLFVWLSL